jgi:hypothetical protein
MMQLRQARQELLEEMTRRSEKRAAEEREKKRDDWEHDRER